MTILPLLHLDGLRVELDALHSCSATARVHPGGIVRLTGPSGCGKTSMLRAAARLQPHVAGAVLLRGQRAGAVPAPAWRRAVAYLPQRPAMLPGTVEDNLRAGLRPAAADGLTYDADRMRHWFDALALPQSALGRDARTLSGGEAARIALLRALAIRPAVLLLDEVTAALDPALAECLVALVREYLASTESGALVVAHHLGAWETAVSETVHLETHL